MPTLLMVLFLLATGCEPWWANDAEEETVEEVVASKKKANAEPAAAAGPGPCVLDQSQLGNVAANIVLTAALTPVQTFTPGVSGNLCQIKVDVSDVGSAADITVQITTTVAGDPTAGGVVVLGAANLPLASVQGVGILETVNIAPAITLTAGTVYALQLSTTDAVGYRWWLDGNTYAGGAVWTLAPSGPLAQDFVFETYMQ